MSASRKILLAACVACPLAILPVRAFAESTLVVHESFMPDRLGASTNLSITAQFASSAAIPSSAISKLTLYAPAGLGVSARDTATCTQLALEQSGPDGCPPKSRVGFGGGMAVIAFPREVVHESFTLDFFFASSQRGHLALLAYANGTSPLAVALVAVAREVPTPKPYGLGFSVEVPPVTTIPGASYASVESAFASLGSANVAYYQTIHGKPVLVHVRGITVPQRCPPTGFPSEGTVRFADGQVLTVNPTIPCPRG